MTRPFMLRTVPLATTLIGRSLAGTDADVGHHGTNGLEFSLLASWGGLTPMHAISAMERPNFVMKGGVAHRSPGAPLH